MSQSGIVSLPLIRGPVVAPGPWQALLGQANKRVYPFTVGAMADEDTTGTTIKMGGLGSFAANDYIIVCTPTDYGNSTLFIPDMSKIRKISSVSATEDDIVVGSAVTVNDGDYIFNIGADGATSPLVDPDFDDIVTMYDDPHGASTNALGYLLTGNGGHFRGWLATTVNHISVPLVDLLITNSNGIPELVVPFYSTGNPPPAPQNPATTGYTTFGSLIISRTMNVGDGVVAIGKVLGTLIEDLKAQGILRA